MNMAALQQHSINGHVAQVSGVVSLIYLSQRLV